MNAKFIFAALLVAPTAFGQIVYKCPDSNGKIVYQQSPCSNGEVFVLPETAMMDISNALVKASLEGDVELVKALLNKGADINSKDKDGQTALYLASKKGHIEVVKALLSTRAGVNTKDKDGYAYLLYAVLSNNLELVNDLLDKGADVNAKDKDGYTYLLYAVLANHVELVKALLDKGADVNVKVKDDVTALHMASAKGYVKIIKALLDKGADVNVKAKDGLTALHIASKDDVKTIRILEEAKAKIVVEKNYNKQEKEKIYLQTKICKSAIGTMMGHSPNIMKMDQVQDDIIYISYVRGDGTLWSYRCKITENQVIWASPTGRWMTDSRDSQLSFTINGNILKITEHLSGSIASEESFNLEQIE